MSIAGERITSAKEIASFRDALGYTLEKLGEEVEDMVVITADVGKPTRANLFAKKFPDRYFNVGIAEQHMISFAAGLASAGAKPVVVGFSMFLMRAWEQIRNSVDRMNLDVKIVGTHAGFSDYADGSSHQCLEDIALMRVLPNMKVIVPADAFDIERSLPYIVKHVHGPVYYRVGRDSSPIITANQDYEFELGRGYVLKDGRDVTIIGVGPVLYEAFVAAEELKNKRIDVAVINMVNVKPIDGELIERYARRTGHIVTVEEHMIYGGLGSAVAEFLSQRYPVPMRFVGAKTYGRSGRSVNELWDYFSINSKAIAKACCEVLEYERR
ncbi:MAG: transketolase family protein [Ignisphaera sp.]|uniref:2-oxoacid oxidoreductase (ferredoxin) n=1 Tax=Ignisphaera aggregans TaxID=334771 RepID=A0A7C4JJB3_9CREN